MTENPNSEDSAAARESEIQDKTNVTEPADAIAGPAAAAAKVAEPGQPEEEVVTAAEVTISATQDVPSAATSDAETKTETTAETAAQSAPTAVQASPPVPATAASVPMAPRRGGSGARRFASQGRREDREHAEEITDPRMRRPAVYEPRSGPSHSRFNPRQPVAEVDVDSINYKNVAVLTRFIDQQGRILSRRKSRVDAKIQRRIKTAIKQARHLALLPYTPAHIQGHRRR